MSEEEALATTLATCARLRAELSLTEAVEARLEALRRQQRELEAQAQVLERDHAALKDFTSAASHDLQAPLRAITHFAAWIEEDLPSDASDTVRMYVARLRDRVERMALLQEKLLDYARISSRQPEIEAVDPEVLVRDVWSLVMPPGGFSLVLSAPVSRCELAAEPLRAVLRNLFSNASAAEKGSESGGLPRLSAAEAGPVVRSLWRLRTACDPPLAGRELRSATASSDAITHHDAPEGTVWVEIRRVGPCIELDVRDDGPGIPEEAERNFRATHVLRTDAPHDARGGRGAGMGPGMGLAIARRHAEHVGGAVFLVPGTGRGAHFRVVWPATPLIPPSQG